MLRPGRNTELMIGAVFAALMKNEITLYATPRGNVYIVPGDRWLEIMRWAGKIPDVENKKTVKTVADLFITTDKKA